ATPPGKTFKKLSLLSGGERSLPAGAGATGSSGSSRGADGRRSRNHAPPPSRSSTATMMIVTVSAVSASIVSP
ncbi:MAG: hypothetical protein ACKODP_03925, partial [Actinomycetota bacterium]